MTGEVGRVGGPGSVKIEVTIDLPDLQGRLLKAGHPLAGVPEWHGKSTFVVILTDGLVFKLFVMDTGTQEEVEEACMRMHRDFQVAKIFRLVRKPGEVGSQIVLNESI